MDASRVNSPLQPWIQRARTTPAARKAEQQVAVLKTDRDAIAHALQGSFQDRIDYDYPEYTRLFDANQGRSSGVAQVLSAGVTFAPAVACGFTLAAVGLPFFGGFFPGLIAGALLAPKLGTRIHRHMANKKCDEALKHEYTGRVSEKSRALKTAKAHYQDVLELQAAALKAQAEKELTRMAQPEVAGTVENAPTYVIVNGIKVEKNQGEDSGAAPAQGH